MPTTQWRLCKLTQEFLPVQQLSSVLFSQIIPVSRRKQNLRKFYPLILTFPQSSVTYQIENKKQILQKNSETIVYA